MFRRSYFFINYFKYIILLILIISILRTIEFTAYQQFLNIFLMQIQCIILPIIGSYNPTHNSIVINNNMLIKQSSFPYNTHFVNTHSYQGFIIIKVNIILKYHWYRLSNISYFSAISLFLFFYFLLHIS